MKGLPWASIERVEGVIGTAEAEGALHSVSQVSRVSALPKCVQYTAYD